MKKIRFILTAIILTVTVFMFTGCPLVNYVDTPVQIKIGYLDSNYNIVTETKFIKPDAYKLNPAINEIFRHMKDSVYIDPLEGADVRQLEFDNGILTIFVSKYFKNLPQQHQDNAPQAILESFSWWGEVTEIKIVTKDTFTFEIALPKKDGGGSEFSYKLIRQPLKTSISVAIVQ